jgi:aryl-alcohol dehydrogenase-like predicted oxidoreductase
VSTVIVGCDTVKQLEQNVEIATNFTPLPATEMARLEKLTAGYVAEASWFKKPAPEWGRPGEDDQ